MRSKAKIVSVLAVAIIVNVILFKVFFLNGSTKHSAKLSDHAGHTTKLSDHAGLTTKLSDHAGLTTKLSDHAGLTTKLSAKLPDDAGILPKTFNNSYFKTGVGYCDIGQVLMDCNLPTWQELEKRFTMLQPGGWYKPSAQPTDRTVIVIPYRDREEHLKLFLQHMHPFLQKQNLEYKIVVVELEKGVIFKKGLLMNIGFIETSKTSDIPCYAFHDIDMLPLNSRILYTCTKDNVHHPARYIKQYRFRDFIYGPYSGGILVFHKDIFKKVNGFSNLYWGWGGEDDDMRSRLNSLKIPIKEPDSNELRYMTWNHGREKIFENRYDQEAYICGKRIKGMFGFHIDERITQYL